MPFRTVVQDVVDIFSPSSLTIHGEGQAKSRRRFHSLPNRPYTTYSPVGVWYSESGPGAVYANEKAMASVISSTTYHTAFSSLSSLRSRCRSYSDLPQVLGAPMTVAQMSSQSRLTLNVLAPTIALPPVIEDAGPFLNQAVDHVSIVSDRQENSILPDLSETSVSTPTLAEAESGSEGATVEASTHSSGSSTITASISSSSSSVIESGQMTSADMFQCLVQHGCRDLRSDIDSGKYSSCRIAEGGFGDIWKGELSDGTSVAVKILRCGLVTCTSDERKGLKRMMREIYACSKLEHENVHQLLGVTIFQDRLGMVSPWMPHGNLRDYLARNPGVDRYNLCIQITHAVKYVHEKNMVHGDIKGLNILVSPHGDIKLTDFDYSIMSNCSLLFTETTRIGGGTSRWMAPELLDGTCHQRSTQTDIYALGMTFLEVITGALPYHPQCSHDAQVMVKVIQGILPVRSLQHFAADPQGDGMWQLFTRCWARKPELRPSASAILVRLLALKPS